MLTNEERMLVQHIQETMEDRILVDCSKSSVEDTCAIDCCNNGGQDTKKAGNGTTYCRTEYNRPL